MFFKINFLRKVGVLCGKNDVLDEVQKNLIEQSIVVIGGNVDSDTGFYVHESLLRLIAKKCPSLINVFITSSGGSVEVGLHIYDALRNYPSEVIGTVRGNAFSTAVIILQARKKRIAFRHSHFLIHNVIGNEININTLRDPQKINKERERLEKSQVVICKIFSDRTNLTLKQIKAEFAKNQEIGADEALGLGLINEVV